MEQRRAIPYRMRIGAAVIPVILFGEMAAFGANGAFLGGAGAFAAITGAMLVLVLTVPDGRFWPRAAPVLITVAAALSWVARRGASTRPWRSARLGPATARGTAGGALIGTSLLFFAKAAAAARPPRDVSEERTLPT